jgi:hypothetical protein
MLQAFRHDHRNTVSVSHIKLSSCLDDGALSMAEFKTFFSDGILYEPDLEKLFNEIDTHNTQ